MKISIMCFCYLSLSFYIYMGSWYSSTESATSLTDAASLLHTGPLSCSCHFKIPLLSDEAVYLAWFLSLSWLRRSCFLPHYHF